MYFCVVLWIFVFFYGFLCCSMDFCVVLWIFFSFSVLFVCMCVLNYCHRVATQLQLNTCISYHIKTIFIHTNIYLFSVYLFINSVINFCTNLSPTIYNISTLTLRRLMSYIYIYMEHPFLMFLDHTQRRSTVGRTPLDE